MSDCSRASGGCCLCWTTQWWCWCYSWALSRCWCTTSPWAKRGRLSSLKRSENLGSQPTIRRSGSRHYRVCRTSGNKIIIKGKIIFDITTNIFLQKFVREYIEIGYSIYLHVQSRYSERTLHAECVIMVYFLKRTVANPYLLHQHINGLWYLHSSSLLTK